MALLQAEELLPSAPEDRNHIIIIITSGRGDGASSGWGTSSQRPWRSQPHYHYYYFRVGGWRFSGLRNLFPPFLTITANNIPTGNYYYFFRAGGWCFSRLRNFFPVLLKITANNIIIIIASGWGDGTSPGWGTSSQRCWRSQPIILSLLLLQGEGMALLRAEELLPSAPDDHSQ